MTLRKIIYLEEQGIDFWPFDRYFATPLAKNFSETLVYFKKVDEDLGAKAVQMALSHQEPGQGQAAKPDGKSGADRSPKFLASDDETPWISNIGGYIWQMRKSNLLIPVVLGLYSEF